MEKFRNKYRIQSHRMPNWDYSDNGFYFITLITQNRECNLGQIINPQNTNTAFNNIPTNGTHGLVVETHGLVVETHGRASLQSNQSNQSNQSPTPFIQLSDFGKIVNDEWLKSFEIRTELFLDEYIIMPNHLHAIVILKKLDDTDDSHDTHGLDDLNDSHGLDGLDDLNDSHDLDGSHVSHDSHGLDGSHDSHDSHVETHGRASLRSNANVHFQNQSNVQSVFFRKPQSISSFIAGYKSAINSKIDNYIDEMNLNIPKYNRNNHFFQPNYHDHIIRNDKEYYRVKEYIINNPSKWDNDKFNAQTNKNNHTNEK